MWVAIGGLRETLASNWSTLRESERTAADGTQSSIPPVPRAPPTGDGSDTEQSDDEEIVYPPFDATGEEPSEDEASTESHAAPSIGMPAATQPSTSTSTPAMPAAAAAVLEDAAAMEGPHARPTGTTASGGPLATPSQAPAITAPPPANQLVDQEGFRTVCSKAALRRVQGPHFCRPARGPCCGWDGPVPACCCWRLLPRLPTTEPRPGSPIEPWLRFRWPTWSVVPSSAVLSAYASTGGDTTVASVYIRPQQPWDPRCLRQLAHRLGREFLLCGDVNAHHPAWGGRRTDPRGREVRDVLQQLGLVILNTGADTFVRRGRQATSTAIDLSVATEGCRYSWSPLPDTWGVGPSAHPAVPPSEARPPRDREYRVVDWRIYRQLFQLDTGGRDLLQLVADNARAATVVTKAQQGQPVPDMQHLALRAARRRAERQALKRVQPELWTEFRRVDAVCRRHARGRRNQGWVLSLAVHLTIQAADLAEQLADQFATRDVAQLPAAPPPAALPCPASCHHPGWVAAQKQELCSEPIRMHELSAQVLDPGGSLNEILLRGPRDRERLVEPDVLLGLDRSLTRPLEFERLLDLELEWALGFLE
ncbi:hypothetical protein MTO96_036929 [Rhipicephalus appendiculatus]